MSKNELLAALEADRNQHISFLQAFIHAPSPNPPGDTRDAAAVISRYLQDRGINTDVTAPLAHAPNIISEFSGERSPIETRRLILNGHIDVFPVGDGSGWTRDPWSGDVDESGYLHGRGGVDMKAGTAAVVIAYAYLHARRQHLRGELGLCAVSDEETGGKYGSKWLLQQDPERWKGTCMVNPEPTALNTVRFGEKGTLRLTFTVRTPSAHGAYLHQTKGAIRTAVPLIQDLISTVESTPVTELPPSLVAHLARPEVRAAFEAACGEGAADSLTSPTVNIGTIRGGLKVNMIPGECVFEADIRLPIGLPTSSVLGRIHKLLESHPAATMEIQEAASNPSNYSPHDHAMVKLLAKNAKAVAKLDNEPLATPSLGATDGKFWRYLGAAAYEYGVSPASMGAENERVKIDEFLTVLHTIALSAWDYLDGPE